MKTSDLEAVNTTTEDESRRRRDDSEYEKLSEKMAQMNTAFLGLIHKLESENTETNDYIKFNMRGQT